MEIVREKMEELGIIEKEAAPTEEVSTIIPSNINNTNNMGGQSNNKQLLKLGSKRTYLEMMRGNSMEGTIENIKVPMRINRTQSRDRIEGKGNKIPKEHLDQLLFETPSL